LGWVWSGGSNLAPGPLGSVAGDPDRHAPRLAPLPRLPLLRTAGGWRPGLRPRVSSAHRPWPQLQVQDSVMGRRPLLALRISRPHFHNLARWWASLAFLLASLVVLFEVVWGLFRFAQKGRPPV
jgi:hypothetical protein